MAWISNLDGSATNFYDPWKVQVSGAWQDVEDAYVQIGGNWVLAHRRNKGRQWIAGERTPNHPNHDIEDSTVTWSGWTLFWGIYGVASVDWYDDTTTDAQAGHVFRIKRSPGGTGGIDSRFGADKSIYVPAGKELAFEAYIRSEGDYSDYGVAVLRFSAGSITGTATSSGSNTLSDSASTHFADDRFNNWIVRITGGTGSGQVRTITDTVASGKTITVNANWSPALDATSTYEIFMHAPGFFNYLVTGESAAPAYTLTTSYQRYVSLWKNSTGVDVWATAWFTLSNTDPSKDDNYAYIGKMSVFEAADPNEQAYWAGATTTTWTVPAGVYLIDAVCIGGGGGGSSVSAQRSGGGGGGAGYLNDIPVTPGESLNIVVGGGGNGGASPTAGGTSSIARGGTTLLSATGGQPGGASGGAGGTGSSNSHTGGTGGAGSSNWSGGGGGGAASHLGNGGSGGAGSSGSYGGSGNNSSFAGAGGGGGAYYTSRYSGAGGGGSGLTSTGAGTATGGGGATPAAVAKGGGGMACGRYTGNAGTDAPTGTGGFPGGGGGGYTGGNGAAGAIRIIWGYGRNYPSTNMSNAGS